MGPPPRARGGGGWGRTNENACYHIIHRVILTLASTSPQLTVQERSASILAHAAFHNDDVSRSYYEIVTTTHILLLRQTDLPRGAAHRTRWVHCTLDGQNVARSAGVATLRTYSQVPQGVSTSPRAHRTRKREPRRAQHHSAQRSVRARHACR